MRGVCCPTWIIALHAMIRLRFILPKRLRRLQRLMAVLFLAHANKSSPRYKIKRPRIICEAFVARPGFEPRHSEPKSDVLPLYYRAIILINYLLLSAGNCKVEGACCCCELAGACCVGTVEVFISCNELLPLPETLETNKTDTMLNTASAEANIHVPLSNISLVCFTPINWLLNPAIEPLKPPPLGFWINMIRPSTIHTKTIRINRMSAIINLLVP